MRKTDGGPRTADFGPQTSARGVRSRWPRSDARRRISALLVSLLLFSGCTVGPRYAKPTTPEPPSYKEVPPDWKTAQPSDQIAKGRWWEIFQDSQLNALEEQINVSNQNLKAAEAQFQQARALVRINRAAYYPTVTAGASAAKNSAATLPSPRLRASSQRVKTASIFCRSFCSTAGSAACLLGRLRLNQSRCSKPRLFFFLLLTS